MKRSISFILSSLMIAGCLSSCSLRETKSYSPNITVSSSDAEDYAVWLTDRVGELPDKVVMGTGSSLGFDMSDFEDNGYIIRKRGDETIICAKSAEGLDLAVRKYALSRDAGVACADTVYHEGYRIEKLSIADADISNFTVFYPEDANENMKFAVSEFRRLIKKACGVELPAVKGEASGEYTVEFKFNDDPQLKNDGFVYSVNGTHLTFEGAVKRGSMYAVWRFLEKELGWDGLIYGNSVLAEADSLNIPDGLYKTETPAFEYLNMWGNFWGKFENDKATPNKAQNSYGVMEEAHHGMYVHKFCDANTNQEQICYTDEGRYQECLENVNAYIDSHLENGAKLGVNFFDVDIAQGDTNNYCKCTNCMKLFSKERSNSGAVIQFANRLSEEVNDRLRDEYGDEYHEVLFKVFAYSGSNVPPKNIRPNDYIHVTFCTDLDCSNHLLDGSECGDGKIGYNSSNNADFAGWLEGWCSMTKSVYVWYYALDLVLDQYTTIETMYGDFSYMASIGVDGIFYQSTYHGLGVQRIQHQILSEFVWDIDMSEKEFDDLYNHVLEREFGFGSIYVREYLNLWEDAQNMVSCWHCWGGLHPDARANSTFYSEKFNYFLELFDNAKKYADSKEMEERADLLTCHIYYLECFYEYALAEDRNDEALWARLDELYGTMFAKLNHHGFDPVKEGIITVDYARAYYPRDIREHIANSWLAVFK